MSEERSYIAFISYRHKPLDAKAARMIEKRIESYRIPRELRKTPDSDRLGYVFRDEDELPLSSSLSDSILHALDRSQFLIVICTPDLPQSKWCEQEIRYFLQTHDRDHLLAVLADGSGEVSFSPLMLHEYDESGNAISDIEPLAATSSGKITASVPKNTVKRACACWPVCWAVPSTPCTSGKSGHGPCA